eukprot:8584629-Lingulodinium_polyedra.AAC.1
MEGHPSLEFVGFVLDGRGSVCGRRRPVLGPLLQPDRGGLLERRARQRFTVVGRAHGELRRVGAVGVDSARRR